MKNELAHCLVIFLIVAGCSRSEIPKSLTEGELKEVWAVHPEETDEEPWFGRIWGASVWRNRIIVGDSERIQVIVLDHNGSFIQAIGRRGGGPGEFRVVRNPTTSPSGKIFVVRGPLGAISEFYPDGSFIKVTNHWEKLAGTGWGSPTRPLALDDTTLVFEISSGQFDPIEEQLKRPLLIASTNDGWSPLMLRRLPEKLDKIRANLVDSPTQTLMWPFTACKKCRGPRTGEVIVVRLCDPYTIRRASMGETESSFTYLQVEIDEFVRINTTPTNDYWQYGKYDRRYRGEYPITGTRASPNETRGFTFAHSLRGMALIGHRLVLYVEVLTEDFPHVSEGEGIEQKLYVVNLDTERVEMVVPFHYPYQIELHGALENGTLVFSTNDPIPGILAYRIVSEEDDRPLL